MKKGDVTIADTMGARKFGDFVRDNNIGFTDSYQKFLDLIDERNRQMLVRFEELETEGDAMAKECGC